MVYVLEMTSPDYGSILDLYQRTLSIGVLEYLQRQSGMRIRRGIYAAQVVLWLMITQRLQSDGTLASAIQLLLQGIATPFLVSCKRVCESRISSRTGGYCRARQKLPRMLCRQVMQEILTQLRQILGGTEAGQQPVFLLDGSSLELEHCSELVRAYPPAQNQHGQSHWPVVRMVVLHEVESGLAEEPSWGPMYGPEAVSEQELAEKAMEPLPSNAVILGDRNFGIFRIAYAAQQRGLAVVLRLTDVRAYRLVSRVPQPGEQQVRWQPSRWDGGKHYRWPPEAVVEGRVIRFRMGRGKSQEWLYLFTTLDWPAQQIIELYARRWNIETDLRSLKRTVRLHHIAAKSEEMMEKELLIAMAAYNLVRAVMCLAAKRNHLDPRQLSFAQVLNVVNAAWPKLSNAQTREEHHRHFEQVLAFAAQCTLPKRRKRRSYPRTVWRRSLSFPFSKEEKSK